jgi:hypothetical protein
LRLTDVNACGAFYAQPVLKAGRHFFRKMKKPPGGAALAERRKFRLGVIFRAGSRQMSDFADNLANGVDDQPRLIEIDIVPAVRLGDMRGMEGTASRS